MKVFLTEISQSDLVSTIMVDVPMKTDTGFQQRLKEKGLSCSLVNARFVKPIDEELIREACKTHRLIVAMEENVASGGYGEKVREYVDGLGVSTQVLCITIPDEYVEHGNVELLKREIGIDADSVTTRILTRYVSMAGEREQKEETAGADR